MTRDGTVGRSDATEPNLAVHRDIDPVRMMRTRFADPIRASSPPGLHQQAGHMTASDFCAARYMGPSTHEPAKIHHAARRCGVAWRRDDRGKVFPKASHPIIRTHPAREVRLRIVRNQLREVE